MSKKNEILLSIALEGDSEVKRKLQDVGETGKRSLDGIGKNLGGAKKSFSELRDAAGGLSRGLAPLAEGAGLGGLLRGGLFAGLSEAAGPAALLAALSGIAVHLAKVSDETARAKGRLAGLGDDKGFDRLTERAKRLGTDVGNLQPRYERFLALQQKINANPAIVHPPGFAQGAAQETAASVQVFGGGQQISAPSRENFGKFDSGLVAQIRRDVKSAEEAQTIAADFEQQLASKGLTADSLRSLQQSSPNAAKFVTSQLSKSLSQGFANPGELAAAIERGRIPQNQLNATAVINAGAKPNAEFEKAAEDARGLSQSFEALQAAAGRIDERLGEEVGHPINKALTGAVDKVGGVLERNANTVIDTAKRGFEIGASHSGPLPEVSGGALGGLIGATIGGIKAAGDDVGGALKGIGGAVSSALPDTITKADTSALPQQNEGSFAKAILDSASRSSQAAGELSQAAHDLSAAAAAGKASNDAAAAKSGEGGSAGEVGSSAPISDTDTSGALRPGETVEDLKTHGGDYPGVRVSGQGEAPNDIYDLNRTLEGQRKVGEFEGDKNALTTRDIRQQLGLPTADNAPGERLYPGGPRRYRRESDPNYQPAQLGTYDQNMNFVPAAHQPYPRVGRDTFDTKGGGEDNPIYDFGQPQPLNFPAYVKELRDTLPGVPLPRPRPQIDEEALKAAAAALARRLEEEPAGFAGGGPVRHFEPGGHVSGPGTATSDSIPAMLSDKEYVIKASSARKIGRRALDWLNAGAPLGGFARGGFVSRLWSKVKNFAGGGSVSQIGNAKTSLADLGPGQHSITADPDTGGAYIDGVYYAPGSPILDDPTIRSEIQKSLHGTQDSSSKSKYKSEFVGQFGEHAEGGPIGAFASGGSIDRVEAIRQRLAGHFANGGLIKLAAGGPIGSVPHLATGGGLDFSSLDHLGGGAPTLDGLGSDAGAGGMAGHLSVDLRTNQGDFRMMAPEEVARQMSRAAIASSSVQTSPRPSWYGGN